MAHTGTSVGTGGTCPCTRPPSSPRGPPSASRALDASLPEAPGPLQCIFLHVDRDVWTTSVNGPGQWWGLHGPQPHAQQLSPVLRPQWSLVFTPDDSQGPQGQAGVSLPPPHCPAWAPGATSSLAKGTVRPQLLAARSQPEPA